LGAGLAGLSAAHELRQHGRDVLVLEARGRPGGRVLTLREPFADGQHAEAGALFVPANHDLTLKFARRFRLPLQPAMPLFSAQLYYVRGRPIDPMNGSEPWPLALTDEERNLGRAGLWQRFVEAGLRENLSEEALDRMSGTEFLRSRGASAEAIALLRLGFLDMLGDGMDSYSALDLQRRLAHARVDGRPTVMYAIRGGTDRLPQALAAGLGDAVRYDTAVLRIEPGERSASVIVERNGATQRLSAERVVCTLPFSVLRKVEVAPAFSPPKTGAIERLAYSSIVRVFLQFGERFWARQGHVLVASDQPVRWVFDQTINQPGSRGILEAQLVGVDARRVARLAEPERIEFALSELERIFPGAHANFERGASVSWDDDPWSRGATSYFRPGEMLELKPHVARAEGRVHFAGEHTSSWPGWMQGALESGERAAREVLEAA
jgi:monoamine oxidase